MEIKTINNRYHIIKSLGCGAMGEVFLTEDKLYDNKKTAVKVIKKDLLNETNITRFKKEFEVMTHLRHPNLIRVYDFGKDTALNNYFITMQYIEGRPLSDLLSQTPPDREKAITINVQLLRALAFIHSRNIIHRDIKPENILLMHTDINETGDTGETVKLMDFGLSDLGAAEKKSKGTLMYMAPETLTKEVDYRVDIFAAGMIFYQLLTNQEFYQNGDTSSILNLLLKSEDFGKYQSIKLDEIKDAGLRKIVRKMLIFDPDKRYQDCSSIIAGLKVTLQQDYLLETIDTRRAYVLGTAFVGRQAELSILTNHITSDNHQAVLIHGEAGVGKSRLMTEFKKYCQLHDHIYLEGNCYEHMSRMYAPFLPIITECLYQADNDMITKYGGELKKLLSDHEILHPVRVGPRHDPQIQRQIFISTIIDFLIDYCNTAGNTFIIYLNDTQWADNESMEVAGRLIRKYKRICLQNHTPQKITICLSCREEGLETIDRIIGRENYRDLQIRPFAREQVADYVHSTFGKNRSGVSLNKQISAISRRVGGNPLYLQEFIKSLVESGYIERTITGWELMGEIETIDIPDHLSGLIDLRLRRLHVTPDQEHMLQILALLDRDIAFRELIAIYPVDITFLLTLVTHEIVRTNIVDEVMVYNFSHDLIKETIAAKIADPQAIHQSIAAGLEEMHNDQMEPYIDELAYHYYRAGNKDKAVIYLEKSADIAVSNFFNDRATTLYKQLLSLIPDDNLEKRLEILMKMQEPYRIIDNIEPFLDTTDRIISIAEKTGNKKYIAQASLNLGRYYMNIYNLKKTKEHLEYALKLFQELDDEVGIVYTYNYLGVNITNSRKNYDLAMEYLEKSLHIARKIDEKPGIAFSTGNIGVLFFHLGNYEKAFEYEKIATDLCITLGNKEDQIYGYLNLGEIHHTRGDYEQAIKTYNKGLDVCLEINARLLTAILSVLKAKSLFAMGQTDVADQLNNHYNSQLEQFQVIEYLHESNILKAKIIHRKGRLQEAAAFLEDLLRQEDEEKDKASFHYEIWKMTKSVTHMQKALTIYKKLYADVAIAIFKKRIDEMEESD